ncbi:MerR family transcriptional regulator [Thermanaerosceptrum fracticalcis]|uniref:MerR family transcriptional regulator n=1 Tax=Thermanaerosceptrum fracticalcis TaxID=1712410 RepID=A0A7G6E7D4_THEFR|nr:MerR family transcriptional regulator [Thermanaerosceptrum fracticalcis]
MDLEGDQLGNDIKHLRIGELAQLAGVSPRTIDYYTQIGLLESERTPGNHRLYTEDSLTTIKIVKRLQEQHFSLDEICQLFKCKDKNSDLMEISVSIKELLDNLQKKMVELYTARQATDENELVTKELVTKGLQVIQTLMVLLGEHVV